MKLLTFVFNRDCVSKGDDYEKMANYNDMSFAHTHTYILAENVQTDIFTLCCHDDEMHKCVLVDFSRPEKLFNFKIEF